jgi:hypothetical protein
VYQPSERIETFAGAVEALQERVPNRIEIGGVNHIDPQALEQIASELKPTAFRADLEAFSRYFSECNYAKRFPGYYSDNLREKAFEHFVALQLLSPTSADTLIDMAAEGSPLGIIASERHGCAVYGQDIMYEPGLVGNRMGGDAANMPVPDNFASLAAFTCSLEHFEGDSDVGAVRELSRVLATGGRFVVIPLYLWTHAAVQTDPTYSAEVRFDDDAVIYCTEGWRNRHARFYSPETLKRRLFDEAFNFEVFRLENTPEGIYARWALLGTRV